ncbi:methanol dehydrogenase [Flavobacterium magnum]|uniref:Methanol dehydrogenase n=1 Tax=Flavobacterium magnum TaxID=2162713 RepID=A0A2S0R9T3_9FLAO|nr:TPM domain-containing protein [Flavobacterium magnum]AWA28777.1 methanol dehydrogenase [Flavobacterium magnum]
MKKRITILTFFVFFLLAQNASAQFEIPPKPDFQTSVYDYAHLLSEADKAQLEEKLIRYSDSTSNQIVVAIIETLNGDNIETLTPNWGHKWGVGGSEKDDNGVMIVLAKKERKIWISAGYGLEDRLTAGIGGEITRNIIVPEFKAGDYYAGLDKGTDAIFEVIKGKYKGERKEKKSEKNRFPFGAILVIIIIIAAASRGKGGRGGRGGGGGIGLGEMILLSSLGRGGSGFGGGGSSGGGGFGGGFGGGGFSGGGSGGSW